MLVANASTTYDMNIVIANSNRDLLLPMMSLIFPRHRGPSTQPRNGRPAIRDTCRADTGDPRGFMLVSFDVSFDIIGDVHTTLLPPARNVILAETKEKNHYLQF